MRILCALHAHLGLVTALRRFPELRGEPVIVGGAPELRLPVITASAPARAAGVWAGQALRQAQQLCPGAAFVPFDTAGVASLRDALCAALHHLAPTVEVGDEETYCDLSGRHAQHADPAGWAAAVSRQLSAELDGEPPAVGVAGTRFVARMAARAGKPGRIRRVPAGEEAAFLGPLPLDVLPIDAAMAARLAGFGLDCLGAVAGLSPADLQRQFGPEGLRLHRLVRGEEADGVHADPTQQTWSERLVLDGPVGELEILLQAGRHCTETLGGRLAGRGLAAAELKLIYEVEEGQPVAVSVVTPAPVDNVELVWAAVLGLLGDLHPPAPVTAVRIEASRLSPAGGRQTDMWRPGDAARDAVAATAGRLRARFGADTVRRPRLALDPGDLPERRFTWEAPVVVSTAR